MTSLKDWGLDPGFDPALEEGLLRGRIIKTDKGKHLLITEQGEIPAVAAGSLLHHLPDPSWLPTVGDWVEARLSPEGTSAVIQAVVPRRGELRRTSRDSNRRDQASGNSQVLAANVDQVLIVHALDKPVNQRSLERYLTLAYDGGAKPMVVLSKADLAPDPESCRLEAEAVAWGAAVLIVSTLTGAGVDELESALAKGSTSVLLGPSGAGKSTLLNALMGRETQAVGDVRTGDAKGRHTTTGRHLFRLPGGALVIDTPGLRALGLGSADQSSLDQAFPEIAELAKGCRFADCTHSQEPGCAVQEAVRKGELAEARLAGYHKLIREQEYLIAVGESSAQRAEKAKWKSIKKDIRRYYSHKR